MYAPVNPDTAMVVRRTTGWLVYGPVLILLMGSVLLAGVAFALMGVVTPAIRSSARSPGAPFGLPAVG
ncbi:UNVERIFIED_CONTAM: hypothetical protein RKD50_008995 [Streptomyces canus]